MRAVVCANVELSVTELVVRTGNVTGADLVIDGGLREDALSGSAMIER